MSKSRTTLKQGAITGLVGAAAVAIWFGRPPSPSVPPLAGAEPGESGALPSPPKPFPRRARTLPVVWSA